ncbi:conserved hypothetical protein [Cyanobium sp. PCC 7001]|nr:conserved hypothetical protein [Cyanobium sp. PCC 7001]
MVSSSASPPPPPEGAVPPAAAPEGSPQDSEAARASALYARISADAALTQELFRQALQDPHGALDRIVSLGDQFGLPVSREAVKAHVASLDDGASKQWLLKARGGL